MGQVLNKQLAPISQAFNKVAGKAADRQEKQKRTKEELSRAIADFLDKKYPDFDDVAQDWKENEFCQAVYETVEGINEESGALQFRLPPINFLQTTFNEIHTHKDAALTKKEFEKIIEKVIKFDSFYIGQGAKDIFLYIFGVPVVALLAKRMIPGPTASISDDLFLPAVTSGTVYYLAKTNKL